MKQHVVTPRRLRMWLLGGPGFKTSALQQPTTLRIDLKLKQSQGIVLDSQKTPLHLNCSTSPRNAFGTGQLPFPSAGAQLRGTRGPETILRRRFGDGHTILEDKKIE